MLSISIFGLGYVGSVTAACLAHLGHRIMGVDITSAKIDLLEAGRSPILEARMDDLVSNGRSACRLHATTDSRAAVHESEVSFICVGTPSLRTGKLDLRHVENVAVEIGTALREKKKHHVVVLRSTVLPRTTESTLIPILEDASGLRLGRDFAVCYNPEFMREGSAVADFLEPPFTILGVRNTDDAELLRQIYSRLPSPVVETGIAEAEMLKYVSNSFHALKVTFANEIGTICKYLNVDTDVVTRIFTSDTRLNISAAYLKPGFAFGGSCLPKDLRALTHRAKELDLNLPLLTAIAPSNAEHLDRALDLVMQNGSMNVAMLGLSFKSATDDLRESPHVHLVKRLLGEGRQIRVWDQNVVLGSLIGSNRRYIEEVIPHIGSLLCSTLAEAIDGADTVVVGTNGVSPETLREHLKPEQFVVDLVNLAATRRTENGGNYQGICW